MLGLMKNEKFWRNMRGSGTEESKERETEQSLFVGTLLSVPLSSETGCPLPPALGRPLSPEGFRPVSGG